MERGWHLFPAAEGALTMTELATITKDELKSAPRPRKPPGSWRWSATPASV